MSTILQFFILSSCLLFSSFLLAADTRMLIEPIYGFETALVRYPEPPRYVSRAFYGGRVIYGTTLLSGEGEYTVAQSRKDYPSLTQTVEDKAERLAIGLRSTIPLGAWVGAYFRAGGRASQGETIVTTAGVEDTKEMPLRIDPYGGAGLQMAFHPNFALNAGVTLIRNGENKYDAQYALGLTGRFGNR